MICKKNNTFSLTSALAATLMLFSASAFSATTVDLKESKLNWKATKKIGEFHEGAIALKSAKAEVKGDKIQSAEFVVDMASFTDTTIKGEWNQKFITHVKSDDFFSVEKFPTATLVIDKQPSANTVSGMLTIKGKTEPVNVDFVKDGNTYTGTLKVDRTKFGITYGSENFFKNLVADKIINNEFDVTFKIVLAADTAAKKDTKKSKK